MKNIRDADVKAATPGPWKRYDGYGVDFRKPVIVDSIPDQNGKCMANCICYVATTNPDFEANARLIAAAPELLDAVIELREALKRARELARVHNYTMREFALHCGITPTQLSQWTDSTPNKEPNFKD